MTGSFVGYDGRELFMFGNTRLRLVGIALFGTVLLSGGSPALASHVGSGHSPGKASPAAPSSTIGHVDIGTAEQWIRLPDGTIQRVM